jgi:DNA-binding NarL/FixJ family response regulator
VLVLLSSKDENAIDAAADAGAAGWFLRDSAAAEMINAIRAAVPARVREGNGAGLIHPGLEAMQRNVERESAVKPPLTPREEEILQLLISGDTSREIAGKLTLSTKTVEAHKFNLMRKLDVHSRGDLIKLVLREQIVSHVRKPVDLEQEDPVY